MSACTNAEAGLLLRDAHQMCLPCVCMQCRQLTPQAEGVCLPERTLEKCTITSGTAGHSVSGAAQEEAVRELQKKRVEGEPGKLEALTLACTGLAQARRTPLLAVERDVSSIRTYMLVCWGSG